MRLTAIALENFRAWESFGLAFDGRITALVGPNGAGKTAILEAAWYSAALSSHRTSSDESLVRRGCDAAIIRSSIDSGGRVQKLELEVRVAGRARTRLGGAPVGRRRDVAGILRAAIFSPERVAIVRGDPSERRRFADELLVMLAPRYHGVIRDYERALRQRNALLRDIAAGRATPSGLEAWDEALAGPGGELAAGRARAIDALAPEASKAYTSVGGRECSVSYAPRTPAEGPSPADWTAAIRRALESRRADELARAATLAGPHRDDVEISIDAMPARTHASQGEAWTASVALAIGAHATIASQSGDQPLLLLDDAFNPLDPARRVRLAEALPAQAQIIITAADPAEIPERASATRVEVSSVG